MNLHKPKDLLKFLSTLNIRPKKSLSQNFLIDKNIIDKIIKASEISDDDIILEIGPGTGVLTNQILKKAKKLIAIEKDNIFAKKLKSLQVDNLNVKNEDFLKSDLDFLLKYNQKIKVISSIPYNLTSLIISKLLKNHMLFSSITLLVQKEVAQRIVAPVGSKMISSFSIFVNFYANTKIISYVSKNCFFPKPKVDSAIIKLSIKEIPLDLQKENFHKMVRIAFSQRRKKVITCLSSLVNKEKIKKIFGELNIDQNARAENLSLNDFLFLFKKLF